MTPLLSIAIPTHNRARYAVHAIRSLLAISDTRLEVVVSDTSTDGELAIAIERGDNIEFRDPRLKYFRQADQLNMTENHNAAIAATTGEYVCLIGDDDTITPDALVAAAWARENRIQLVAPNVVANYAWPDFRSRYFGAKHAARLYVPQSIGTASLHDSNQAVVNALSNAAQGTDGLPKIYHGIVKRTLLQRLRDISGAYFHGASPDVSGAIGLALCCDHFVVVDYPLTIPGASGGSNTGRSAMNQHKGRLTEETQTKSFVAEGWSLGVPRFFSVETVWAHAALETIRKISPERLSSFNFARLIAICNVLHPEYSPEIEQAISAAAQVLGTTNQALRNQIASQRRCYRMQRLFRILKRMSRPTAAGGRSYISDLDTIAAASPALAKHIAQCGWKWEKATKGFIKDPSCGYFGGA